MAKGKGASKPRVKAKSEPAKAKRKSAKNAPREDTRDVANAATEVDTGYDGACSASLSCLDAPCFLRIVLATDWPRMRAADHFLAQLDIWGIGKATFRKPWAAVYVNCRATPPFRVFYVAAKHLDEPVPKRTATEAIELTHWPTTLLRPQPRKPLVLPTRAGDIDMSVVDECNAAGIPAYPMSEDLWTEWGKSNEARRVWTTVLAVWNGEKYREGDWISWKGDEIYADDDADVTEQETGAKRARSDDDNDDNKDKKARKDADEGPEPKQEGVDKDAPSEPVEAAVATEDKDVAEQEAGDNEPAAVAEQAMDKPSVAAGSAKQSTGEQAAGGEKAIEGEKVGDETAVSDPTAAADKPAEVEPAAAEQATAKSGDENCQEGERAGDE